MKANMHEAKSKLSQLAERAANGERVVIAKAGKPYVELVPCRSEARPAFGWLKDQIEVSDDFDSVDVSSTMVDLFDYKA